MAPLSLRRSSPTLGDEPALGAGSRSQSREVRQPVPGPEGRKRSLQKAPGWADHLLSFHASPKNPSNAQR